MSPDLETESIRAFFKKAKNGDKYELVDLNGNPATYQMQPGSYANVVGQEDEPFIQHYLNSIDNEGMGRKLYPKRVK